MVRALVFGIDGQDGSYLAELLLSKGAQVIGWSPDSIPVSYQNVEHIQDQITLIRGDLGDQSSLFDCLEEHRPDQIYNLASPSSPSASWKTPVEVGDITALGVARLLEGMRRVIPKARFYQASSSELFGEPVQAPQNEDTPFQPRNPYGIAKLHAHWLTVRYREQYRLHAVSGILFNHESPRRGPNFVTRKITSTAARIKLGLAAELRLGNLAGRRDWGFAGDYVEAMWLMTRQAAPHDYVIGSGETHSVSEFCELAFSRLGLDYQDYVVQDPQYYRPNEETPLVADPSKARGDLAWQPTTTFEELVVMMVDADLLQTQKLVTAQNKEPTIE